MNAVVKANPRRRSLFLSSARFIRRGSVNSNGISTVSISTQSTGIISGKIREGHNESRTVEGGFSSEAMLKAAIGKSRHVRGLPVER
jgi:hypothetical protein